ncbi:MAG: ATP-dependent DNA helicase RecG [Phycisphaerae bacterium]|nr:ATP-dependent DNA helicase RecG [Phycisphaerae bacterium]
MVGCARRRDGRGGVALASRVDPAQAERIALNTPLDAVGGIGPTDAGALGAMGLTNVGRLVAHLPHRHEKLEAESDIGALAPELLASARGEVLSVRALVWPHARVPRVEAVIADGTGRLEVVWFNMLWMRHKVRPGVRVRVQGRTERFKQALRMVNPQTEVLPDDEPAPREARVRPIYPATERMPSWRIARCVGEVLDRALPLIEEHLPEAYRVERGLPALADAYRMMHAPRDEREFTLARRRLAYDELLLLQLGVHMKRAHLRRTLKAPALRWSQAIDRHIRERFPFPLTPGQDAVVKDIVKDLSSPTPTNRLIQGDVGSGKTVVALYAMLMAVADGKQAALMAPTEILAEQHGASMGRMLEGSRVRLALLTGSTPEDQRASILRGLEGGEVDLLVGTHALLGERVRYASLAVAVIDEQHRFGVHQRAVLRSKGTVQQGGPAPSPLDDTVTPHVLVMTATPIPRTLAITLFGDLDVSTIAGLPPGRQPVRTIVVGPDDRPAVYRRLRQKLDAGEQAFVVVPVIDGAEEEGDSGLKGVRALVRELQGGPLEGKRLAALHGRLKPSTRDLVMGRFRAGLIDALVATTVIEVGVDVPNATNMIVEHADRFGLAQLHQLRGRVGRGEKASACVLIADPTTEDAQDRLKVMERVSDGFALAERDLEIRGPGELFGTRQSGLPPFKVADLRQDLGLLTAARRDAAAWIDASPGLSHPQERLLLRRLVKTYGASLGLGDVG